VTNQSRSAFWHTVRPSARRGNPRKSRFTLHERAGRADARAAGGSARSGVTACPTRAQDVRLEIALRPRLDIRLAGPPYVRREPGARDRCGAVTHGLDPGQPVPGGVEPGTALRHSAGGATRGRVGGDSAAPSAKDIHEAMLAADLGQSGGRHPCRLADRQSAVAEGMDDGDVGISAECELRRVGEPFNRTPRNLRTSRGQGVVLKSTSVVPWRGTRSDVRRLSSTAGLPASVRFWPARTSRCESRGMAVGHVQHNVRRLRPRHSYPCN
jgi:hypothetical protein